VADLNGGEQRQEGYIIRSIEFNNKNAVALVAGASGVVSLYQVRLTICSPSVKL